MAGGGGGGKKRDPTEASSFGGVLWTILLLGLCFCLVDMFYLFYAHHLTQIENDTAFGSNFPFGSVLAEQQTENNNNNNNNQQRQQQQDTTNKNHKERIVVADRKRSFNNKNSKHFKFSPALAVGKEEIIAILQDAVGVHELDDATVRRLPTWQSIVARYGTKPKIFGLDTCHTFQTTIPPEESFVAPAGAFNSGTNLLAELLIANCHLPARQKKYGSGSRGVRWQVNWGKHQPPKWRLEHDVTSDNKVPNQNILPVVTIRDPYLWMQSMCRHRYAAHWFHRPRHCPNLVANWMDLDFLEYAESGEYKEMSNYHHNDPWLIDNVMNTANFTADQVIIPLYVKYKSETTNHKSLAHLWNDWYNEYIQGDFPRLIVRFEDLLFFGKEVTEQACKCAGGELYPNFKHIGVSAKQGDIHGNKKTSLVEALIRYGHRQNVTMGMSKEDILYAKKAFDGELMKIFSYSHP